MVKGIGPLFGLEVDGERKNLFGTLAKAKELETALVAEGCIMPRRTRALPALASPCSRRFVPLSSGEPVSPA
jgi:hypothetical protein